MESSAVLSPSDVSVDPGEEDGVSVVFLNSNKYYLFSFLFVLTRMFQY